MRRKREEKKKSWVVFTSNAMDCKDLRLFLHCFYTITNVHLYISSYVHLFLYHKTHWNPKNKKQFECEISYAVKVLH